MEDEYYDYGNEAWYDDLVSDYGGEDWWNAPGINQADAPSFDEVYGTGAWDALVGSIGATSDTVKGLASLFKTSDGKTNWKALAGLGGGVLGALYGGSNTKPTGYQGKIPTYTMQRSLQEGVFDPSDRRPGSIGRRYFTDYSFVPTTGTATPAPTPTPAPADTGATGEAERDPNDEGMAAGGIAALKKGRYLRGSTDGMEDKLRTSIENKQPAALSHGEFVVPADVVSHLGNGNSEAGAKKLYEMMDRIRKARTGTKEQGRQINPNKFMPR